MKWLTLTATLVLVLMTSVAIAATTGKATGGIKYTNMMGESAQSDFTAQGTTTDARGRVHRRVHAPNGTLVRSYVGVVECYAQSGNIARFSGRITNFQGQEADADEGNGRFFNWAVQDNGEGAGPPDLARAERDDEPIDCGTSNLMPTQPVEKGNVQVH